MILERPWRPRFSSGGDDLTDEDLAKILENPKVQEAVGKLATAKLSEEHAGLLKNRDEFKTEKEKLAQEVSTLREAVKNWEGLDAEELKRIMANIEASEEAKLIAAGKGDEVLRKKTERLRQDYDAKIKTLTEERDKAKADGDAARQAHDRLKVETAINSAISQDGSIFNEAMPDIHAAGGPVFSVNDKNEIVSVDGDGKVVMGKDGEKPLQPGEWLESMKSIRPHWWRAPKGGGAAASERDATSGVTGFTAEQIRNMPPEEYRKRRVAGEIQ